MKIIEVPVDRRPSAPSSSPSSHRVLVNITIASGDSASRPLYVLSVSVPTSGDGHGAAEVGGEARASEETQRAAKQEDRMAKIASPVEGGDDRLPPPPQPPSSPPPPIWAGGECECSCPCMGSSSDEWDNDFSPVDEAPSLEAREERTRNTNESVDELVRTVAADTRREEAREEGKSSVSLEEAVKGETSSQHDYFSGTEENSSTIDWTTSNYETNSESSGVSGCSGTTPLPPEPTILILEGEAPFTIVFFKRSFLSLSFNTRLASFSHSPIIIARLLSIPRRFLFSISQHFFFLSLPFRSHCYADASFSLSLSLCLRLNKTTHVAIREVFLTYRARTCLACLNVDNGCSGYTVEKFCAIL